MSSLTLGTANFGSKWGDHWTLEFKDAERLFLRAYDAGINAVDTANVYNQGESEAWLGQILRRSGLTDRLIISTKYGYLSNPHVPSSGGSGRAAMIQAVDKSLQRLGRDNIDILYLHLWDRVTPVEETLESAARLVDVGKIRSFGLSNVPAWYLARAQIHCRSCGLDRIAALQLNYNLLTRYIELEYADILNIGDTDLISWGPLANGLLACRYLIDRQSGTITGEGRMSGGLFTTGTIDPYSNEVVKVVEELAKLADEYDYSATQLAIAWLLNNGNQKSTVFGVSNEKQLDELLSARDVQLEQDITKRLSYASAPNIRYPHRFLEDDIQMLVHGEAQIKRKLEAES